MLGISIMIKGKNRTGGRISVPFGPRGTIILESAVLLFNKIYNGIWSGCTCSRAVEVVQMQLKSLLFSIRELFWTIKEIFQPKCKRVDSSCLIDYTGSSRKHHKKQEEKPAPLRSSHLIIIIILASNSIISQKQQICNWKFFNDEKSIAHQKTIRQINSRPKFIHIIISSISTLLRPKWKEESSYSVHGP